VGFVSHVISPNSYEELAVLVATSLVPNISSVIILKAFIFSYISQFNSPAFVIFLIGRCEIKFEESYGVTFTEFIFIQEPIQVTPPKL